VAGEQELEEIKKTTRVKEADNGEMEYAERNKSSVEEGNKSVGGKCREE
jgi:hypothetical protein